MDNFDALQQRIKKLSEERSRKQGELDSLLSRLKSEFNCNTLDEARALHKEMQEELQTKKATLDELLAKVNQDVLAMESAIKK